MEFPDLRLSTGMELVAGFLHVPLSKTGDDFILLLCRGQLQDVHWAGKPNKTDNGSQDEAGLHPRKSFKVWSETIVGKSKAWTDEQLESAGFLALIVGKVRVILFRIGHLPECVSIGPYLVH